VSLSGQHNTQEPGNHISTSMSSALDFWLFTPNSIGSILRQWVVYMCDMVSLGEKSNIPESKKPYFYFKAQCTWPLDLKINGEHLPWVVYMCDMVTQGGKDNGIKPETVFILWCPVCLTIDLSISKSIGNIFFPWVVYMCDIVTLGGKDNGLQPWKPYSYFHVQCAWPLTFWLENQ
jgi:hypothetical protein